MDKIRSHRTEITIHATPEQVWKALTDPVQLAGWFPIDADVQPGEGGRITLRWGQDYVIHCNVKEWDPPRRLRMTWEASDEGKFTFPGPTAVDIAIEGSGGATVLRLVHSGFASGEEWDREYDGTRRGWRQELASLKVYLERHAGKPRRFIMLRRAVNVPAAEAWNRLMGLKGLLKEGSIDGLKDGDRFAFVAASGDRLEGAVAFHQPGMDFCGVVESLGGAYVQARLEDCFGQLEAHVWLSLWDTSAERAAAIEERLRLLLERLFPG